VVEENSIDVALLFFAGMRIGAVPTLLHHRVGLACLMAGATWSFSVTRRAGMP
jgi:hypothetical protein